MRTYFQSRQAGADALASGHRGYSRNPDRDGVVSRGKRPRFTAI